MRISLFILLLILISSCGTPRKNEPQGARLQNITQQAAPYDRKDWSHWTDEDKDCQNTRQELLIATSSVPVQFKITKDCTVKTGQWYGAYTGRIFTMASDVDIDHIVPLAHAHRHGADTWTKSQRRAFANDTDNLLVVDDSTNQSKSDQAPHEWLPPLESYWCEYGRLWQAVKDKYKLRYSSEERITLNQLAETCQ